MILHRSSLSWLLFAPLVTATFFGQGTAQSSGVNVQETATALAKMHAAWGPRASTPNTSLTIQESGRSGQMIAFRLHAEGLPKDKVYSLLAWPVTQKAPSSTLDGVTLDASGLAVCAGRPGTCGDPGKPDDPIDIKFQPVPGEPIRVGLASSDGAVRVFAKIVPLPLRGEDKGCAVEGVLLTPGAELVLLEGFGFAPGAEVRLVSESEGERQGGAGRADETGHYVHAVLPYKQGLTQGTLRAKLKSAGCSPAVSIPWGRHN